jgi:hypothetical protein
LTRLTAAAHGTQAFSRQTGVSGAAVADQLHMQFGANPTGEMVASWSTPARVRRLRLAIPDGGFGQLVDVEKKAEPKASRARRWLPTTPACATCGPTPGTSTTSSLTVLP